MKRGIPVVLVALTLGVSLRSVFYGLFIHLDTWRKYIPIDDIVPVKAVQTDSPSVITPVVTNRTNSSASSTPHRKPLFILHVGPSKTGTTTIQYFSVEHDHLLQKDNIYYLGHFKNSSRPDLNLHVLNDMCYSCKEGEECPKCDEKWKEFEGLVNDHYRQGHNVFVSNEMFSGFRKEEFEKSRLWDRLTPMLQDWNVRIVFAYRRYHEWVPSKYFQLYNPNSEKKGGKWPDKGGRRTPLFPEYFESHQRDTFKHPGLLKKKWGSYFQNVWVFNMHKDGDFLTRFFRQMLPEARHALEYLSSREASSSTINPSTNKLLHYDMIAVEAYMRGWLDISHSRNDARQEVEHYAKELGLTSLSDFPLKCLSRPQSALLLNESLSMEKDLVPNFYSASGGKDLEQQYSAATERGKFCSVDVDSVLKEDRWREFFRKQFSGNSKADEDNSK